MMIDRKSIRKKPFRHVIRKNKLSYGELGKEANGFILDDKVIDYDIGDIKVDYVFPYVNSDDPKWIEMAKPYFPSMKWSPQRFRELGFLKYLFRGLSENLSWLNSIVILVDFMSQVPNWLNVEGSNVRIVTLDEFVPSEYLPTFNSNTIEMFLADIPGLSDYIIYGNDDFIPLCPMKVSDYFTSGGIPRISYKIKKGGKTAFRKQCKRNWDKVARHFPESVLSGGMFYEQLHEPQPITLSLLKEASSVLMDERIGSITRKRDFLGKNLSQYIYFDYAIASGKCANRKSYYLFKELYERNLKTITTTVTGMKSKWICLNDSEHTSLNIVGKIIDALDTRYPRKCAYEK